MSYFITSPLACIVQRRDSHFSGVISLTNLQNFPDNTHYQLNVSVSDGVYTSFSRVKIEILPENRHNPVFAQPQIEVRIQENQPRGTFVTKVVATDEDFGAFGEVYYYIPSEMMREFFEMNKTTGVMSTKKKLDRESRKLFEVPVAAFDYGGRPGYLTVRVRVGDENDNPPVFQLFEYKAAIYGNLTTNSVFMKVSPSQSGFPSFRCFLLLRALSLHSRLKHPTPMRTRMPK